MYLRKSLVLLVVSLLAIASASNETEEESIEHPFVLQLSSPNSKLPFELTVEPSDTVLDLKRMIMLHENGKIPIERQQLILDGKTLEDNQAKLSSVSLEHRSSVIVNEIESKTSGQAGQKSYFGVDPNDKEAVRARQRELGEDQFRQMFGEEINPDHLGFHEFNPDHQDDGPKLHERVKGALKWLYDLVSGKKKEEKN